MGLAIDGSVSNFASAATLTVDLTTTNPNDVVVVFAHTDGVSTPPTISGTAPGLSGWTQRAQAAQSNNFLITEWWAIATQPLTNLPIDVSAVGGVFIATVAFGVSGANMAAPFDPNPSLPATAPGAVSVSGVSTIDFNTMLIMGIRFANTATPTPGAFGAFAATGIADLANDYTLAQYLVVATPQTNITATVGTGSMDTGAAIVDAIFALPDQPSGTLGLASAEW